MRSVPNRSTIGPASDPLPLSPALRRLSALGGLSRDELAVLQAAERHARPIAMRRDVVAEGQALPEPMLLLSGWACRVRMQSDGRRQILGLILPGELIGVCRHRDPFAMATIMALTDLSVCPLPVPGSLAADGGLAEIYVVSAALDEFCLLRQIMRLGRMTAYERLADFLLEVEERLALAGLAVDGTVRLPLTQETLADALGLTPVHINRTIQAMRRNGMLILRHGNAILPDRAGLAGVVDYRPLPRLLIAAGH